MLTLGLAHGTPSRLRALERALATSDDRQVLWKASDGAGVLASVRDRPPALVLVDCALKRPGALEVVRKLQGVCAVLLLDDGSREATAVAYDGIGAGALDVSACPDLNARDQPTNHTALLAKLRTLESMLGSAAPQRAANTSERAPCQVLIGSSTGGPEALRVILSQLPRKLNAAYVVAQHVDEAFSSGLADWLRRETGLDVRIARHESQPQPDAVLIAGTNDHLVLDARRRLIYTPNPVETPFRPSADALFSSYAAHSRERGVAVLLTGMGKDGAQGLLALKRAGWHTIAQDAATSVVFGMPKAAIEIGAAREVLALSDIADGIARAVRASARSAVR